MTRAKRLKDVTITKCSRVLPSPRVVVTAVTEATVSNVKSTIVCKLSSPTLANSFDNDMTQIMTDAV